MVYMKCADFIGIFHVNLKIVYTFCMHSVKAVGWVEERNPAISLKLLGFIIQPSLHPNFMIKCKVLTVS